MEDGDELTSAAANGDEKLIKSLLDSGANPNSYSAQGFRPACIAAFWGYSSIVRLLLDSGADVNGCNKGTLWTPLHCAAFQGHGKVVMTIMEYKPDLTLTDSKERTAADFASAIENIWPFFAAANCKRTPKSELIRLDIVKKVSNKEIQQIPQNETAYFSRPGSAYIVRNQSLHGSGRTSRPSIEEQREHIAFSNGDVLTDGDSPCMNQQDSPSFNAWRN
ncbi:receptor-interacting serine/threonine-protein kinase 4-like [Actinia tenebrosa]|uniref:Receptor-interacting serine/threonine-protein kinase 4-like n=1 Tax=Actinia tenebrosa TaxID=6105 RepID=A0A6P8I8N6_ACTTE|nr:receptor-interacting serine/threonine-protein kinase 4-like [Actinia tenebrosa]